jgi:hypothetical protein
MTQAALGYPVLATSFSRILAHLSFFFTISFVIMEGTHASLETPACLASFQCFCKRLSFWNFILLAYNSCTGWCIVIFTYVLILYLRFTLSIIVSHFLPPHLEQFQQVSFQTQYVHYAHSHSPFPYANHSPICIYHHKRLILPCCPSFFNESPRGFCLATSGIYIQYIIMCIEL